MTNFLFSLKRGAGVSAVALGSAVLVLAGCGAPPAETTPSGSADPAAADYFGCIVSDEGGFDDRSFNQNSYEGLKKAEADLGIKIKQAESSAPTDFQPNVESMVAAGCDMTVTIGFNLGDTTKAVAEKNPESHFAIVDYAYDPPVENVKPIIYDTAQAAFLAGYLAAGTSKTGVVGTYGGMEIPTVTIFMDGFVDGVQHYNEQKGEDVKVLGWGESGSKQFVGDFSSADKGAIITNALLSEGADVIMPVAGPVGTATVGAVVEANKAGKDAKVIWVDADGYETLASGKEVLLTSVMKLMADAVEQVISDDLKGTFSNEPYVGTLENGGVALAPFHDSEADVPAELKTELDTIKADIISGKITVESAASPK